MTHSIQHQDVADIIYWEEPCPEKEELKKNINEVVDRATPIVKKTLTLGVNASIDGGSHCTKAAIKAKYPNHAICTKGAEIAIDVLARKAKATTPSIMDSFTKDTAHCVKRNAHAAIRCRI